MRMPKRVVRLQDYIGSDECFHAVRKHLDPLCAGTPHAHDCFELFLVESGRARHRTGAATRVLERGTLVFIRPNDVHAVGCAGQHCAITNIMFPKATARHLHQRYGSDLSGRFFWHDGDAPLAIRLTGAQLERAVNHIHTAVRSRRTLATIEQFLLSMMMYVLDGTDDAVGRVPAWLAAACRASREPAVFRRGGSRLRSGGGTHPRLCVSPKPPAPRHVAHSIREPSAHPARRDAASNARSLASIAEECGTGNLSHFHRLFREHYGITPANYRKRHEGDPIQPHGAVGPTDRGDATSEDRGDAISEWVGSGKPRAT